MDDAVADGDVGFDHLGHHHAPRMVEIAYQGVGLHVDCLELERKARSSSRRTRETKEKQDEADPSPEGKRLSEQIPRDPVSCDGSDSLLKETVTLRLSEKANVWTGRPRMAGRVNSATLGTMCPSITLGSILSRDTAYNYTDTKNLVENGYLFPFSFSLAPTTTPLGAWLGVW